MRNIFLLIFCLTIISFILLTGSRNAMLGIIITGILIFGYKKILIIIFSLISLVSIDKFFGSLVYKAGNFYTLLPFSSLIDKLSSIDLNNSPRLEIWNFAITRIQERPLLGWGGSTFSFLQKNYANSIAPEIIKNAQHSHNMALELAHNFGIPLSIILTSTLLLILIKT